MKIKFPEINLTGIQAVLLDLDDTLYFYQPAHAFALKNCYVDEIVTHFSYEEFTTEYKKAREHATQTLYPQGACRSRLFALQKLFYDKHVPQSYVLAHKFETIYWQTFISHMKLEEDAAFFLQRCKKLGVQVCVVTDMLANIQIQKLTKLNITDYIHDLVSSEEAGSEKPHAAIFQLALNRMNVKATHAIMIGDSLSKDIQGAKALGISVYQVEHV